MTDELTGRYEELNLIYTLDRHVNDEQGPEGRGCHAGAAGRHGLTPEGVGVGSVRAGRRPEPAGGSADGADSREPVMAQTLRKASGELYI